jgi:hypothetical protein
MTVLAGPANLLAYSWTPDAYGQINAILDKTQDGLSLALVGAVMAGTCEEVLFRGALQPRAGIVITALLFAAGHLYYGATPILAFVFVSGLAYGLLRQHMNTTTAIIAHATYDVVASLPTGVGRFGLILGLFLAILAGFRSDPGRWSRYLAPLVAAGSFLVLGSGAVAFTGSVSLWKACGVAALLAMVVAVGVEGLRSSSRLLIAGGILAWLAAAAIFWSEPWPGVATWIALPAFLISFLAGCGAWFKLALSRYENA